jgi:hypothetical protein
LLVCQHPKQVAVTFFTSSFQPTINSLSPGTVLVFTRWATFFCVFSDIRQYLSVEI